MNAPIIIHIRGQAVNDKIKGIDTTMAGLFVVVKIKYIAAPIPIAIAKNSNIFFKGFLVLLQLIHMFDTMCSYL